MKTLHQIVIASTQKKEYQTTITPGELGGLKWIVITKTNHMGVVNDSEELCDTYREAIINYQDNVKEYAVHTALMNL